MRPLRVWAPDATAVEAVIGVGEGRRVGMEREASGSEWWSTVEAFAAGTDYRFSVNGGPARPDPRSPWQPLGVDGASRTVDLAALAWTDAGWQPPLLADALVYEAHVGTFSEEGTFEGAIGHLDHLVELGVTHLELMPVAEFPGARGWGYDGVDLYAPHSANGGPTGLAALVDACHARGLAVVLDVVYNHLGPSGNYLGEFGPYFTDRYRTPWGLAVNFDGAGSHDVRRFFIDNALMWLRDYHVDALRLDAVHAIVDTSAVHFLEQLAAEVHDLSTQLGRSLTVIAESDLNDPRLIRSVEQGGYALDAQWSDDFHHSLHSVLTGERDGYYSDFGTLGDLAISLVQGYRYAGDYSRFRRRRHGRPSPNLDGNQLLGYLQNHDQVGNRAAGERSAALMNEALLMIAAAVVMTAPFVPMLFQGEEWAASTPFQYFTDHEEELGRAVSKGRREEFAAFGWRPEDVPDPQDPETFARSRLDWLELNDPAHQRMYRFYRSLIALRRAVPELRDGRLDLVEVSYDEKERWMRIQRGGVIVAFNLSGESRRIPTNGHVRDSYVEDDRTELETDAFVLGPEGLAVMELD